MSFSATVKEELSRTIPKARHCQIAEIAGMFHMSGRVENQEDNTEVIFDSENVTVAKKYFELVKKAFQSQPKVEIRQNRINKNRIYSVTVSGQKDCLRLLAALKLDSYLGEESTRKSTIEFRDVPVNEMLLLKSCCKRAFVRGIFLAAGSITDPEKGYHFEIVTDAPARAKHIQSELEFFGIPSKTVERKGHIVVYIKEGALIVDTLNVMEAHMALMELENVRILKEVRNDVNRRVNCETANINKTVNAAVKQIEDIQYIKKHQGLDSLSPALEQVARLRLEYPEAPLKELGEMLNPPVGKSGVNHRLKKLSKIAEELRS